MKAGQVMCGWGGGTLLLLRQMPRLLGLISSAKRHPVLAKNKLKCLWPVCVHVCVRVCISGEKEHCLIQYQALPGAHPSRAVMVHCSVPSTFNLVHCSQSLFPAPISIFRHPSSRLFHLCSFSFSLHLYSIFPSAAKLAPTAVKREERVGAGRCVCVCWGWGGGGD